MRDDLLDIINKLQLPNWVLVLKAEFDPDSGMFSLLGMRKQQEGLNERLAQPTPLPSKLKRGRPSKKGNNLEPVMNVGDPDADYIHSLLGDDEDHAI